MTAADALTVFDRLEELLKGNALLGVGDRVYTGIVPDDVTVGTGWIPPYIFLQPTPGAPFNEPGVDGEPNPGSLSMRFITTVAASDVRAVLGLSGRLQRVLSGYRFGRRGQVFPETLQQEAAIVTTDDTVIPPRPFIALAWRLRINRNP